MAAPAAVAVAVSLDVAVVVVTEGPETMAVTTVVEVPPEPVDEVVEEEEEPPRAWPVRELRERPCPSPVMDAAATVRVEPVRVWMPNRPVLALKGTTTTYMVPALANVEVAVRTPVQVVIAVAAKEESIDWASSMTDASMGAPTEAQASWMGPASWDRLRLLSQSRRMHVITSVRKFPPESRHMHSMFRPLQVKSPDCTRQS